MSNIFLLHGKWHWRVMEDSFDATLCINQWFTKVCLQRCIKMWLIFDHCLSSSLQVGKREHNDVIKWKHFPHYWPFVRGIHRSPVNPPHNGQWRRALMFSLIRDWINGWVNNPEAGDLIRHCVHYDVTVVEMGNCYLPTPGTVIKNLAWFSPNSL